MVLHRRPALGGARRRDRAPVQTAHVDRDCCGRVPSADRCRRAERPWPHRLVPFRLTRAPRTHPPATNLSNEISRPNTIPPPSPRDAVILDRCRIPPPTSLLSADRREFGNPLT